MLDKLNRVFYSSEWEFIKLLNKKRELDYGNYGY